jgi:hypothetical protein
MKEKYDLALQTNDTKPLLELVSARIIATPEESDVVHDLLTFLAERMIEMNKTKNQEILGFHSWLEQEIGAPIQNLSNKMAIDEYYLRPMEEIVAILKKNKNRINTNSSRRDFKEKIEHEVALSKDKLLPLLSRIKATDDLIDQIVYRLYGLTDAEMDIVNKSVV